MDTAVHGTRHRHGEVFDGTFDDGAAVVLLAPLQNPASVLAKYSSGIAKPLPPSMWINERWFVTIEQARAQIAK